LECVAAVDGRQGLDLFSEHPEAFQLVLLDLTMPRMDGAATVAELRKVRPEIPIILMSGYTEQDAVSQFGNTDLTGFIQKPIQQEQLQAIVQRALGQPVDQFRSKS